MVQEKSDQPYGFPANIAKQIVLNTFQKYDSIPKERLKQKLLETNQEIAKKCTSTIKQLETPVKTAYDLSSNVNDLSIDKKSVEQTESKPSREDFKKVKQDDFQSNPSSYNGAIRENYEWTQSIKDIDVRVKISSKVKSSKEVKVKIEKDALQVLAKDFDTNAMKILVEDKLAWKVRPDDCTWSLFPGDHIHIYLEKVEERWWENLLAKEDKIDLKKIQPEKPFTDLDTESQMKIKQMMFDEQQKSLVYQLLNNKKISTFFQKRGTPKALPSRANPLIQLFCKTI